MSQSGLAKKSIRAASFPVRSGEKVEITFATPLHLTALHRTVQSWARYVRQETNPIKLDSAELAVLAVRRWREGLAKRRTAKNLQEIKDHIQDNPHAEVAVLILAQASWQQGSSLVGLCHFRRTWCNNLFIDFLAVHPSISGNRTSPLGGVGTGVLHYVTKVASEIDAGVIWGEATQNSVFFYRKVFERDSMNDLIYVEKSDYTAFRDRVENKWSAAEVHKQ
jgi:hypothetical protein